MSGYTLYPSLAESGVNAALRVVLAVTPMALFTVVARRMRRGWIVSTLPWLLLALAAAVYAGPTLQLFAINRLRGTLLIFGHLIEEVSPFVLIPSLAVLAVLGVKKASNRTEPA